MAERESAFLRFLILASPQQVKLVLGKATSSQLKALAEVCFNLLHGEIDANLLKSLKPYSSLLRSLSKKSLSANKRRTLASRKFKLVQKILKLVADLLP